MDFDRQMVIKLLIHVIAPLTFGVLVYHFLTDRDMFMNRVLEDLTNDKGDIGIQAPDWVKYNLPDGLYTYSFASAILIIHECRITKATIHWIILAICIPIATEIGQKIGTLQGTYDPLDIVWFLCGSLTSILILNSKPQLK